MKLPHLLLFVMATVAFASCKPAGQSTQERQKEMLEQVKSLSHEIASTRYSVDGGWVKLDAMKQADYQDKLARRQHGSRPPKRKARPLG